MNKFQIGQTVKFTEEVINKYKDNITPIGYIVNKIRRQKMIITNIDEDGFIEINNSFPFNEDFLEIVK